MTVTAKAQFDAFLKPVYSTNNSVVLLERY